jgi:hypothetical protein
MKVIGYIWLKEEKCSYTDYKNSIIIWMEVIIHLQGHVGAISGNKDVGT